MMMTMGVNELLKESRLGVERVDPQDVGRILGQGAILVDTRTTEQRLAQGELPQAIVIDRTVLEWRLDPGSASSIPEVENYDQRIILACRQGFSSSLAAFSLRRLGLGNATDLVGGVENWIAHDLPVFWGPAAIRL